jgi:hypothetical protein
MTWVIILVVVLVALAPLWHFMPSRRQREVVSLRDAAARQGLTVQLRPLPVPAHYRDRLLGEGGEAVFYGKRLKSARGRPRQGCAWWRHDGDWLSEPRGRALPAALAGVPDWVLAAQLEDQVCGLYWQEKAGAEGVDTIAALLAQWQHSLESAEPSRR